MKKFFCIFYIIIFSQLIYSEEINSDNMTLNDVLKIYQWSVPTGEWTAIKFSDNNVYLLGESGEGGEPFCRGTYEVIDNKIILNYPFEIEEWLFAYERSKATLNWFFEDQKTATFFYEHDYIDFYVKTRLKNGNKILKNHFIRSPFGAVYNLDGFDVIKYNKRKDHVVVTENLRMRERPSIDAETKTLSVWLSRFNQTITGNITHKYAIHSFDAITVKKDTIDGIVAPWYHINVILGEVYSESVWVFGGYLKEISEDDYENNVKQYYADYYNSLINSKIIKKEY